MSGGAHTFLVTMQKESRSGGSPTNTEVFGPEHNRCDSGPMLARANHLLCNTKEEQMLPVEPTLFQTLMGATENHHTLESRISLISTSHQPPGCPEVYLIHQTHTVCLTVTAL